MERDHCREDKTPGGDIDSLSVCRLRKTKTLLRFVRALFYRSCDTISFALSFPLSFSFSHFSPSSPLLPIFSPSFFPLFSPLFGQRQAEFKISRGMPAGSRQDGDRKTDDRQERQKTWSLKICARIAERGTHRRILFIVRNSVCQINFVEL